MLAVCAASAQQPQFELPAAPEPHVFASLRTTEPRSADGPAQPEKESSSTQPAPPQDQRDKAEDQIHEQERQRVAGILPSFNVSYRADAVSMTAEQKLSLAFRSVTDPVAFGGAAFIAGYHELNDDSEFGWGAQGYGKRVGAAYLDSFNGAMIGNGILPALLHQDPRYFRLGHGSTTHRMAYALMTNVMCRHDNKRRWEPTISNVGGNILSGAISNLYYPSGDSGIGETFTNGLIVTAQGGIGSIFQEFWPDISRKFLHKDPTNGLDAEARAADAARKQAKADAKREGKSQPQN